MSVGYIKCVRCGKSNLPELVQIEAGWLTVRCYHCGEGYDRIDLVVLSGNASFRRFIGRMATADPSHNADNTEDESNG